MLGQQPKNFHIFLDGTYVESNEYDVYIYSMYLEYMANEFGGMERIDKDKFKFPSGQVMEIDWTY